MPLVVDASVALAWALPYEISPYADAVLTVVERDGSAFACTALEACIEIDERG
ncbi:MAG TPA: hypothetical protein VI320_35175 [Terracidiphilus sp.]|jgi:hypothetical protein